MAQEFLKELNAREEKKLGGWEYRLPTEAQWEYACRGGASSYKKYHFGDVISHKLANYDNKDNLGRTRKVGDHDANKFGLHDMHGNVCEWCADWYEKDYYAHSPKRDPLGPSKGSDRVRRGGSWWDVSTNGCRSASRGLDRPDFWFFRLGFRVALVPTR